MLRFCMASMWCSALLRLGHAAAIPDMSLLHGNKIPSLGLGTWDMAAGQEAYNAVKLALQLGYRMIDTAQMYGNEADIGRAIKDSGIPRHQIWVQSKVNTDNHGYQKTIGTARESLRIMGLDYLDCFLVHSPFGGKLIETYDALLQLQKEGVLRSVGVSNFDVRHIEALLEHGRPRPIMNQFELHPMILAEHQSLVDYCMDKGILVQAYGSLFVGKTELLSDSRVTEIVNSHPGKTAAQVLLRWGHQKGFQLIPKSVKRHRLEENMDLFDFELSSAEVSSLDSMPLHRIYWNPIQEASVELGETEKHRVDL